MRFTLLAIQTAVLPAIRQLLQLRNLANCVRILPAIRQALLPNCWQCGKLAIRNFHEDNRDPSSQKGGTGKTTLSLHLAVAAQRPDRPPSLSTWTRRQVPPAGRTLGRREAGRRLGARPRGSRRPCRRPRAAGADIAIIDTAPHSGDVALAAAEAADLVLIPCRAGILDLRAIGTTARAVKLAGKRAYVVLNTIPPAHPTYWPTRAAVAVHGLDVAPVALQQRAAYAHALTAGQTAQEYEPGREGGRGDCQPL